MELNQYLALLILGAIPFVALRTSAQLQILYQDDTIATREHVAIGILDDVDDVRLGFPRPLMPAGDAFPFAMEL